VLTFVLSSFAEHKTIATVVGLMAAKKVLIDGVAQSEVRVEAEADGVNSIQIVFVGSGKRQTIQVLF
jgi:hypothetical protein